VLRHDLSMLGKWLVTVTLAGPLLMACDAKGPNAMREYINRDGLWGWDSGAGCENRQNAWLLDGETLEMYRNDRLVNRGLIRDRRALYDNRRESGDGSLEYADWHFISRNPENHEELGLNEVMFAIRGGPGRPTTLVARNQHHFTNAETGERTRVTEPYAGGRLVHCDEWAAHQ